MLARQRVSSPGMVGWVVDLLVERDDPAVLAGFDHAEIARLVLRHRDRSHGDPRVVLQMLGHHLARVHPVDVVGTEHAHDVGTLVVDQVQVLIDRIGRTLEPVGPAAHLRRDRA